MNNSFKRDWILCNSLASVISMGTLFLYPLFVTLSVVTIQVVILKKYLGWRALLWALNPFLVTIGLVVSNDYLIIGILISSLTLEFVFFITTGMFSRMIWTLIVGVPFALFTLLMKDIGFENITVLVCTTLFFPILLWIMEAYYLDRIIKKRVTKNKIINPEILDA